VRSDEESFVPINPIPVFGFAVAVIVLDLQYQ
jgi:hypothetical protein